MFALLSGLVLGLDMVWLGLYVNSVISDKVFLWNAWDEFIDLT